MEKISDISELFGEVNVPKTDPDKLLAKHAAERAAIDNRQRKRIFSFILWLIAVALGGIFALLVCIGLGVFTLESSIVITAISAVGAQSFLLLGFVTRGLYLQHDASARRTFRGIRVNESETLE